MYSTINSCKRGQFLRGTGLTAPRPALLGRAFFSLLFLQLCATPVDAAAPPIEPVPDEAVLIDLPDNAKAGIQSSVNNPTAMAGQVQGFLQQARTSGDPRFLGYAQRALQQFPEDQFNARLRVLRASMNQSLHQFDTARDDIERVVSHSDNRTQVAQAWLTLASLELAQGHYEEASTACDQVIRSYPGLIAASCQASVAARTGQAQSAYDRLQVTTKHHRSGAGRTSLAWVEGTLAEIAAQRGLPAAGDHFQSTLALSPDDLYSRTAFADWLIGQNEFTRAASVTQGYDTVDSLAVLRAIALQQTDVNAASHLIKKLRQRFEEARWRGDFLHKRDLARFLLDIEEDPQAAFPYAWKNWQTQREPLDTRLALRTAQAAGKTDALQTIRDWLEQNQQQDQRYPEVTE